jgi:pentose-5-phosphate-3-epimerase
MRQVAIRIVPYIIAANLACLGDYVAQAERTGADLIHVDVKGRL